MAQLIIVSLKQKGFTENLSAQFCHGRLDQYLKKVPHRVKKHLNTVYSAPVHLLYEWYIICIVYQHK